MNPIGVIIVGGAIIAVGAPILIVIVVWFEEASKDTSPMVAIVTAICLAYPIVYTIVAIKYIRWWLWDPYNWPWSKVGGVLTLIGIASTILLFVIAIKAIQIIENIYDEPDEY